MKFICPACAQLSELDNFRVEGPVLVVQCGFCGTENRVTAEARTAASARLQLVPPPEAPSPEAPKAFDPPEGHCPKCIATRPSDALVCTACGLVYDNFRPEEWALSKPLAAVWTEVTGSWEDPAVHERFIAAALASGELPAAGRLYRIWLAAHPRDERARAARDEVLRLATVRPPGGMPGGTALGEAGRKLKVVITAGLALLGVALTIALYRAMAGAF